MPAAYESQALPVGSVQRPDVPPSPTTHRAGVMHDGPSAVSHDAPSIASSLQVPICCSETRARHSYVRISRGLVCSGPTIGGAFVSTTAWSLVENPRESGPNHLHRPPSPPDAS